MNTEKTEFLTVLESLGSTDIERAARLGVNPKTIERARRRFPESLIIWGGVPALLRAIANDLERNPQTPPRHQKST
jgi:hypothetical protein